MTIFWVRLSYQLDQLCLLGYLNKQAESSPVSLRNSLFKTILQLKLSYQLKAESPGRMAQALYPWDLNKWDAFPSVNKKCPFQDYIATKTIQLTWSSVSQKNSMKLCLPQTWTNEPSLPQCQWEMVFSRPSCHLNHYINLKLCLSETEHISQVFPKVTKKWPFQDDLATKTMYQPEALSLWRVAESSVSWEKGFKFCLPDT